MSFDCHPRSSLNWIKLTMTYMFSLMILCLFVFTDGAELHAKGSPDYAVQLRSPENITTLFIDENEIIIMWSPPNVYGLHTVNSTFVNQSELDERKSYHILNETSKIKLESALVDSNRTSLVDKGNNSSLKIEASHKKTAQPRCLAHKEFDDIDKLELLVNSVHNALVVSMTNGNDKNKSERSNSSAPFVDFEKGCVEKYYVNYAASGSDDYKSITVEPEVTECNITGLQKGTTYTIYVSAQFESGHILNSTSIEASTKASRNITDCHCSFFGRKEGTQCNISSSPWCQCKPQYEGVFCELCKPGYYRSAPYFPCNKCPCSPLSTTSPTCHYREGYLVCTACKRHHTGHLCQSCANGYYRYHGTCIACHCNFNNHPAAKRKCDPYTGACTKCIRNTTGFNCERCRDGYERETSSSKGCILKHELASVRNSGVSNGLIAGICIAVILALCAVVGFVVYRRWKVFPPKPFWTVELKEDHDSVNFSALPGQDYIQHDAADVQDLDFYDKHRGKSGGKSVSNYSKLKEEI